MKLSLLVLFIVLISALSVSPNGAFQVQQETGRGLLDLFRLLVPSNSQNQKSDKNVQNWPKEVFNWPSQPLKLGQISGVAVDLDNNPVIFHRGPVTWDLTSFDTGNRFRHAGRGPIQEDTLITLDRDTGVRLGSFGSGLFYMPHGLHIDKQGNTWVTDVALHQIFKFPKGSKDPSLVLGEQFQPGTDLARFCKPTDVAAASNGVFFVADGYCNNRILKFEANGSLHEIFRADLNVPHSLALDEDSDTLCIADREGERVMCITAGLKPGSTYGREVAQTRKGQTGRVFAITSTGNKVYGVTGPSFFKKSAGFTFDTQQSIVTSRWLPQSGFNNPHDIEISNDGSNLYAVETGPNRIIKMAL